MCERKLSHCYQRTIIKKVYVRQVIKIKSIFPTDKNEVDLIKFINTYQYFSPKDLEYFFNTTYYPKRISKLIQNNILRRYKKFLVLGEDGYNFMKILGIETTQLRYQQKYATRLKFMSHLAAFFRTSNVTFTPSFKLKDKTAFTESSRKYIGVLNIFGTKYLTYHISKEQSSKYLNSVIYDIQKELKYKNIIILIDDISKIELSNFEFGLNSVIICEDSDKELEKLKYLQQIKWREIINQEFGKNIYLSDSKFFDYTDKKNKYIVYFYLIDTEKVNRIRTFMQNNIKQKVEIICDCSIVQYLAKELVNCNLYPIEINNFIEREIHFYE